MAKAFSGVRRTARARHEATRRAGGGIRGFLRQTAQLLGTTVSVLLIGALAAAASLALMTFAVPFAVITSYWLPIAFACALSALLATMFYIARKEADANRWSGFAEGLESQATPDSGLYTHRLELKRAGRERDVLDQFALIPRGRSEAMVVLRQNGTWRNSDNSFSAESIRDQLQRIGQHASAEGPHVQWAVFTTKKGEFAGYQSVSHVAARVGAGYGDAVAMLLSAPDRKTFDARMAQAASLELSTNAIPEGTTVEDALAIMSARGWQDAMIVARDGKPVGVVTLASLIHGLLTRFLPKDRVAAIEARLAKWGIGKAPASEAEAQETHEDQAEDAHHDEDAHGHDATHDDAHQTEEHHAADHHDHGHHGEDHGHDDHAHAGHEHEEHAHDAHEHDAHGHDTHGTDTHGHDAQGHDSHEHEEHGHDDHGHDAHAKEDHATDGHHDAHHDEHAAHNDEHHDDHHDDHHHKPKHDDHHAPAH